MLAFLNYELRLVAKNEISCVRWKTQFFIDKITIIYKKTTPFSHSQVYPTCAPHQPTS